nr:EAL domain-containing protein [Pseudomarimonas arenosa]
METEDAGLRLVDFLRSDCGWSETRIILRTGQPGQAPELAVFDRYDINDYRTKAELTQTRLITAISGAIRSFDQIHTIAENRRGLELIIRSAPDLLNQRAVTTFAEGVLTQFAALLRVPLDGIVCAQRGSPLDPEDLRLFVVGAAGRLANTALQPLDQLEDREIGLFIRQAIEQRTHQFESHRSVLFLNAAGRDAAVFIAAGHNLLKLDRQLIEVFAANISACFSNLQRFEEINFVAFHDGLTGIGNRAQLLRDLDSLRCQGQGQVEQAVALIDIRQFAELNDGLGQELGNQILMTVARRIHARLGQHCALARVGADVFAIAGPAEWVNPQQLLDLFAEPFAIAEHRLHLRISLGLAQITSESESAINLLKQVSIALNRAKRSLNRDHVYFEKEMEHDTRRRLSIIHALHEDFRRDRLEVWFQPQIRADDQAAVAMEALLRWTGEQGFVQPPNVFVPLAEHSGLIIELGYFVLQRSLEALSRLNDRPGAPVRVSVNVSLAQFRQIDFLQRVQRIIAESGHPPQAIELEITESIAMDEPKVVSNTLRALRAFGVRVAVDDFGTGYSSLTQLRQLPLDAMKIDRSFVLDLAEPDGRWLVESIIALSKRLGLESVAEGVESAEQAAQLRDLGCDLLQGYHFARPMPLSGLLDWLDQRAA